MCYVNGNLFIRNQEIMSFIVNFVVKVRLVPCMRNMARSIAGYIQQLYYFVGTTGVPH